MILKITPVKAIFFTKISVALSAAWPPSPNATKFDIILFKVLWHICYLSTLLLLFPLLNSIYDDRDDPETLAKSVCLFCANAQVTLKMIVCRIRHSRFQILYHEMETFCKQADEKTNVTLQHYVDNYKHIYGSYIVGSYMTVIGVICSPLFLPQELPATAKYPFSVEHSIKIIIYLHQSLVGLQVVSGLCITCSIAILLFYSAARLELLTQKIRNVKNENELDACIKLHNKILRYTNEVITVIKPLVFITIMTTAFGVIFGSLNLVSEQPIIVKIEYALIVFTGGAELFMCALSADNLMHSSSRICLGAYESQWFQGCVSLQKKIMQIIFRSQKSEVIRINAILPALSLRYYAGFIYTSCSYFTAIRIMVNKHTN